MIWLDDNGLIAGVIVATGLALLAWLGDRRRRRRRDLDRVGWVPWTDLFFWAVLAAALLLAASLQLWLARS